MISSSKPVAESPRTVPNRAAKRIPASPAMSDDAVNRTRRIRATSTPEYRATVGVVADHVEHIARPPSGAG